MRFHAEKGMNTAQKRHKQNQHAQGQEKRIFWDCQLVFVHCPPLPKSVSDKMVVETYSKLLPCTLGPYGDISETAHTVTINQTE